MEKGYISPLTEGQARVLAFLVTHYLEQDRLPNYEEIARALHMNCSSTVTWHMKRLALLGYIEKSGHRYYRFSRSWSARPVASMAITQEGEHA